MGRRERYAIGRLIVTCPPDLIQSGCESQG
jgi:hypothetical protein